MKKLILILLTALLLFSLSSVSASEMKGRFMFSGTGGLGLPIGDFANEEIGMAKTGYGFGGDFGYFFSDNFVMGASFSYPIFGSKTKEFEEWLEEILYYELGQWYDVRVDFNQKVASFGVFAKYLISPYSQVCPYLRLGVGLGKYSLSGDIGVLGESMDMDASFDSRFYINLGPGIQYKVSPNTVLVVEAMYTHVSTDEAEGELEIATGYYKAEEKVEMDYNVQYFGLYAGLCFFFGGK